MTEDAGKKAGLPLGLFVWGAAALAIVGGVTWATATGALTWSMAVDALEGARSFVASYTVPAYAAYVALFLVMALALFPAQLWVIVLGAMVFGFWPALIVSWAATVLGSGVVFLAARGVLSNLYREKAAKYLARIERGFRQNQFSWILAMRFFPALPYCITNVAPALLGAGLQPFLIATGIGVIPYVGAYTFVGDRAAAVLDRDAPPDVASLAADLAPVMLVVAALPLVSLAVRRWGGRKRAG